MRGAFQSSISDLVQKDERMVVLLGDIGVWAFRESMRQFPGRVLNFGILEQSMVSFAAGLSAMGYIPVVHSIAPFLVERPLEQIKVDFGYQNLPGNLVSVGGSFDYGALGGTHHSPGDVDALLSIPNVQILVPGHSQELATQIRRNYSNSRISYFRLSESSNHEAFVSGDDSMSVVKRGRMGSVICFGPIMSSVIEAIAGEDLNLIYVNEISQKCIDLALEVVKHGTCVVVEPFYQATTAQVFFSKPLSSDVRIVFEGISRSFNHTYGNFQDQMERAELTPARLRSRILRHF